MNKLFSMLVFIGLFLLASVSFADKGVYNPKIKPDEVFTSDMPVEITVSAEIGDAPPNEVEVKLYKADKDGNMLGLVSEMHRDISTGFFTAAFPLNIHDETDRYFKIIAVYNGSESFEGPLLKVGIYEPLPDGIIEDMTKTLDELSAKFLEYIKSNSMEVARQMVLRDARENPDITSVSLNGHTLGLEYRGLIMGMVDLSDPNSAYPID